VDSLLEQDLPRFVAAHTAAGGRVPIVFYAHGGLVAESKGLAIAVKHLEFWKRNGIYPISFVWETGLFETIAQLLERCRAKAASEAQRGGASDWLTDPMLEEAVRALQAPRIWGGMKASAAASCEAQGGATYVARKLDAFLAVHRDKVDLHAVGHSAGSIFHTHFVPSCHSIAGARFKTLQLLAPAVTVEEFKQRVLPLALAGDVEHTTVFTMRRAFEEDDHCAHIYRKSLLYLVTEACEPERKEPILGLAECLRRDVDLKGFFGLGASASAKAEVVWSKSEAEDGRAASRSTTHGGFDDDASTMESVLRRARGLGDEEAIERYPASDGMRAGTTGVERDWLAEVDWRGFVTLRPWLGAAEAPVESRPAQAQAAMPTQPIVTAPVLGAPALAPCSGRRLALTIGINAYPTAPLHGCVADADLWQETLRGLGFEVQRGLRNGDATRERILESMNALIGGARAGDTLVIQYAGHGTQVPDLDDDEAGGDTPGEDEAICPVDFADGKFVIDDDVAEVVSRLPAGVQLTFLLDCCH
jgi:hypothetical protein